MKRYAEKVSINNPSSEAVSYLPALNTSEPLPGVRIARYYDNNGNYLGWADEETNRKYIYGKLYYKTKGAYKVSSRRYSYDNRVDKKISIDDKQTGKTVAYIVLRPLNADDFIDKSDRASVARAAFEGLLNYNFNGYNLETFPDKYNIFRELREKITQDHHNFIKEKRQEILDFALKMEAAELNARKVFTEATADTDGDWNMKGFDS